MSNESIEDIINSSSIYAKASDHIIIKDDEVSYRGMNWGYLFERLGKISELEERIDGLMTWAETHFIRENARFGEIEDRVEALENKNCSIAAPEVKNAPCPDIKSPLDEVIELAAHAETTESLIKAQALDRALDCLRNPISRDLEVASVFITKKSATIIFENSEFKILFDKLPGAKYSDCKVFWIVHKISGVCIYHIEDSDDFCRERVREAIDCYCFERIFQVTKKVTGYGDA